MAIAAMLRQHLRTRKRWRMRLTLSPRRTQARGVAHHCNNAAASQAVFSDESVER
jgi:hypothetical protein